ncbi:DUF3137 domain-containing protein [Candidatus Saccharibacteria bacterium]|nr:DUF3137 domain-containing protein [Candidatus Saccharibacteria bacterium]
MNLEQLKQISHSVHLARGGGGGSSSGGGGGGGFSGGSSYSSSSSGSGSSKPLTGWGLFFFWGFWAVFIIWILWAVFSKSKGAKKLGGTPEGYIDPKKSGTDEEKKLAEQVSSTFFGFQKAWSEFDAKTMQKLCSREYAKRMVLELTVLQNYGRKDQMSSVKLNQVLLKKQQDYSQGFEVITDGQAKDQLIDQKANKVLFTDSSPWREYWAFVKEDGSYKLDLIRQDTAEASKFDAGIAEFATQQGFYYDPDFGWLMMPNRGAIFGPAGFGNADINNHVVGYYKNNVVEFYSYEPKAGAGMQPITVAQAILPKNYDDILVTMKSWYGFKPKLKGLNKVETESVEFNKKFAVWAANQDQATSFELLATNFMEKIYALEFEINIEVVDNVLYLYSPSKNIAYQDMLDVLIWAFAEMKL